MSDYREQAVTSPGSVIGTPVFARRESVGGDISGGVDNAWTCLQVDANGALRVTGVGGTTSTVAQGSAAALVSAWPVKLTDGTNTMPTMDAVTRSGFQKVTDGTNTLGLQQFHNSDNQSLGTFYGIGAGGITQVLNVNGNLDRSRGVAGDALPGTGVPLDLSMTCQIFPPVQASNSPTAGANRTINLSNTANIKVGSIVQIEALSSAAVEWARVNTVVANTSITVDNLVNSHTTPLVYPILFNMPRDAAGEADQSPGVGASMAVAYTFDGATYQRERSLMGLASYTDTFAANTTAGNLTVITTTGTPPALPAGTSILLSANSTARVEVAQVVSVNTAAKTITVLSTANSHNLGDQIAAIYQGLTQAPQNFGGFGIPAEAAVVFSGISPSTSLPQYSVEKDVNAAGLTPTYNTPGSTGMDADIVYGIYQSAPATLTNQQMTPLQVDTLGNLKINQQGTTVNGLSKAKLRNLNATVTAIKASAGTLYGIHVVNNTAQTCFVQLFDLAVASVTLGTTTPDMEIQVAANSALYVPLPNLGVPFGTAISAASTTSEGGSTGSSVGVQVNAFYV